jgi:hypothetical protein
MKNVLFKLFLFSGLVTFLQGCSLNDQDEYCYNRIYMGATAVYGPASAPVNTDVTFQVTFPIGNSCGAFFGFSEFNTGFPRQVAAAVDYTGCTCNEVSTVVTENYIFNVSTPGTYTLHFLTENQNAPIVRTIEITQ